MDSKLNEQFLHQNSKFFEKERISPRNILGSPDFLTKSGGTIPEFKSGTQGHEWNDHSLPAEAQGFVNNNNTLKQNTRQEIVNNRREQLNMDAQHMFVYSDRKGLKLENHGEEKGYKFD